MISTREAIELLEQAAAVTEQHRALSVRSVALRLDVSAKYIKEHLADFPNAFRITGGEIRIPVRDLTAYERARRIFRAGPAT
jgi:hypothetical protein